MDKRKIIVLWLMVTMVVLALGARLLYEWNSAKHREEQERAKQTATRS